MRPKAARIALVLASITCMLHVNTHAARADDVNDTRATIPITLSEIDHPDLHFSFDTDGASFNAASAGAHGAVAWNEHVRVESPIASRNFYLHLDYDTGSATSPLYDGSKILGGNLAVGTRAVWTHPQGIALGADLGFALPTSQFGSQTANDVALVLATMRPWNYDTFRARTFSFLPAVDARAIYGMFTFQFRHQVDIVFDPTGNARSSLSSISTIYAGIRVSPLVSPGIEFTELYLIDGGVPDARRAFFVIMPGVRLNLGRMSPEVGFMTNLGDTVHTSFDRVLAFHVSCLFSFEPEVVTP